MRRVSSGVAAETCGTVVLISGMVGFNESTQLPFLAATDDSHIPRSRKHSVADLGQGFFNSKLLCSTPGEGKPETIL
jgi:hypothetical protein